MMPSVINVTGYAGETLEDAIFRIVDTSGSPVDLTGCAARLEVRQSPGSPLILALSTASGTLAIGYSAGTITPAFGQVMPSSYGPFRHEIWIRDYTGAAHPWIVGAWNIIQPTEGTLV